jgi:hypothetical protein
VGVGRKKRAVEVTEKWTRGPWKSEGEEIGGRGKRKSVAGRVTKSVRARMRKNVAGARGAVPVRSRRSGVASQAPAVRRQKSEVGAGSL